MLKSKRRKLQEVHVNQCWSTKVGNQIDKKCSVEVSKVITASREEKNVAGENQSRSIATSRKKDATKILEQTKPPESDHDETLYYEEIYLNEIMKDRQYNLGKVYKNETLAECRKILIDWLIEVQMYLKAENEMLYSAIGILDLVMNRKVIPVQEMQIVAIVSFWIAAKIHNRNKLKMFTIKKLLNIDTKTITTCERNIITVLDFNIVVPDPVIILEYLLQKFIKPNVIKIKHCSYYLLEIMLTESKFLNYRLRTLCVCAIATSLKLLQMKSLLEKMMENVKMDNKELIHVCTGLIYYLQLINKQVKQRRLPIIFKKYKKKQFGFISSYINVLELLQTYTNNCTGICSCLCK